MSQSSQADPTSQGRRAQGRRALGELSVSPMAWGMWRFRGDDVGHAQMLVETALDAGLDLLDTADIYGVSATTPFGAAETLLGRVLKAAPGLRERFVLATKGGIEIGTPYNSSPQYLRRAVEASLFRLGVERIDLWQIHRPDPTTHPERIAETFVRLRAEGKVQEFGVSNYTAAQTAALQACLPFPLASTQPEFSALCLAPMDDGVLDQAVASGLAVLAWSPLAGGRLLNDDGPRATAVRTALVEIAEGAGVSLSAAACAWVMGHGAGPIPIVGSQHPDRIRDAAAAMSLRLTRQQWFAVWTAARGEPLP